MRGWARAVLVTTLVVVLPVAVVWGLWALGVVGAAWVAAPLVVALVWLAFSAGAAFWKRRPGTGDVLFSDLLLWGWFRRRRTERRLADAVELLARAGATDDDERLRLLKRLALALDAKDPYLHGHSQRVARLSLLMARRLRVPRDAALGIQTAAVIHDVGKLHVPPEVLAKPGKLTPPEMAVMRRHADEGAEMVAGLADPAVSAIVRHHHERFDGGGYPAGLIGESIPRGARIVAVADTFDAITSARPYRSSATHKRALDVLVAEAGAQLDPVVVRAFVSEYARRRGLALWALLAVPMARRRRQPIPVGAALSGLVVLGVVTMAVQVGGGESRGHAAAAQAGVASVQPGAGRSVRRSSARPGRAVVAASKRASTHRARLASAATRPSAASPRRARRPALAAARSRTPAPRTVAPHATAAPPPTRTQRPAAPPRPAAPRPKPPRPTPARPYRPVPAPTRQPTPRATPAAPPVLTSAQQCKDGGYTAYGYRNQGQCVSSQHRR